MKSNSKKIKNCFSKLTLLAMCFMVMIQFNSCFGVKSKKGRGAGKLIETFYVGDEGVQYFVHPLEFTHNSESLNMDITFRYKQSLKDSAVINVSFINYKAVKNADSVMITNGKTVIFIKNMKHLFTERSGKRITARFTGKLGLSDIKNLFENNTWEITLCELNEKNKYFTPKVTQKKLEKINYEVFSLF